MLSSRGCMSPASLPRYLEIAHVLGVQLQKRHGVKVPSAREIARAHGVSVVTASRAIQVLQDKGLIRTVERSGSFMTAKPLSVDNAEQYALVLRSTPGPWFQASVSFSQSGFARIEQQVGARFDVDRFHFDEITRPSYFARRLVEQRRMVYWASFSCLLDIRLRQR